MVGPLAILKMLHSTYISIAKASKSCKNKKASGTRTSSTKIVHDPSEDEAIITNKTCRICLQTGSVYIFEKKSTEDLAKALNTIGGIEINIDDQYPQYLCQLCQALLQGAILFRKTAQKADTKLKKLRKVKLELETYDELSDLDLGDEVKAEPSIKFEQIEKEKNECISESRESITDNENIVQHDDQVLINWNQLKKPKVEESILEINDLDCPQESDDDTEKKRKEHNHECSECVLQFNSYEEYINHKLSHMTKIKKVSCSICAKMFTPWYLKRHMASHKSEPRSEIEELNKKILKRNSLKCIGCDLEFKSRDEYKKHKQSAEHQDKKQICSICNKSYGLNYIKMHMITHESEIAYICDICGKSFKRQGDFNNHTATHLDILPYKCSFCPYKGRRNADLKMHLRTHTGERPYQCDECPQRFVSKSNLNKHKWTHKIEGYFRCNNCGKKYRSKSELNIHIDTVHFGINEHICQYCNNVYKYRKHLLRHQRKIHNTEKLRSGKMPIYLKVQSMKEQENNT